MVAATEAHAGTRFKVSQRRSATGKRDLVTMVGLALEHGDRRVVADCEGWEQLDLGILSSLIRCAYRCREYGAAFEVVNLSSDLTGEVRDLRLHGRLGLAD